MDDKIKKSKNFFKHWIACFLSLLFIQLIVILTVGSSKRAELLNEGVFVQGSLLLLFALSICLVLTFNAIRNGIFFSKTLMVITKKESGKFLFYTNVIIFMSGSVIMGVAFVSLLIAISS